MDNLKDVFLKPATRVMYVVRVMYVARVDSKPMTPGSFVSGFTEMRTFHYDESLQRAHRFTTVQAAADAIAQRNALTGPSQYRFWIVPVKVTETPAKAEEKVVEETVPAKTEYVLKNQAGQYATRNTSDGSTGYARDVTGARHYATAQEAADWLAARATSQYVNFSPPFHIEKHETPATTVQKTVFEYVPSTTTVELA